MLVIAILAAIVYFLAVPVGEGDGSHEGTPQPAMSDTEREAKTREYIERVKTPYRNGHTQSASATNVESKMALRERSLANKEFQDAARETMLSSVKNIVANVPMYGNSGLLTNEFPVATQMWGDDLQSTLETADRTRYMSDHGAVRKIEVLSVLPQGAMEADATPEQRQAAMALMRTAPDKQWSDAEVLSQFSSIARFFGVTPEELAAGLKLERTKVSAAQALQHSGGPPVPAQTAPRGTDAFITVTLSDPTDRDVALFRVKFRTEAVDSGFRLSVVELINQNFKLTDPAFGELSKRFY